LYPDSCPALREFLRTLASPASIDSIAIREYDAAHSSFTRSHNMTSSQVPVVAGNAASAGPAPLPTVTRVVAVLVLAFAGLGLLSVLSQMRTLSQLRAPVLGVLVSPAVAISFTIVLGVANVIFAILILRRYVWALDALIATQAFGLLNNCLYLISPARRVYAASLLAQMQARMPATPGLDAGTYRTIMSVSLTFGIVLGIAVAVVFVVLLLVGRSRYRAVCLSRPA
jgi:hypothetical protein